MDRMVLGLELSCTTTSVMSILYLDTLDNRRVIFVTISFNSREFEQTSTRRHPKGPSHASERFSRASHDTYLHAHPVLRRDWRIVARVLSCVRVGSRDDNAVRLIRSGTSGTGKLM
jgi:hypothetical protein